MSDGAARIIVCLIVALLTLSATAQARVERYALVVGNDQGRASEARLKYAASDARKVYDTLRDVGDFTPTNMLLLDNERAETVRAALIAFNDRIRARVANPNVQIVLFVYYSGHADDTALHLGDTDFSVEELSQLVRGSAATFRLLVLDACRSGALTRVKGGRIAAAFQVGNDASALSGAGLAFITASSATEDAQESDELHGSLFTHTLVSGLSGAADRDGDGSVVIEEAYRYAYDATLRLTSRTRAGLQHPTFQYDFRGQGKLVLTRPRSALSRRGLLQLPRETGFLVMRDHQDGSVVAELGAHDESRTLALPPGHYFLLGRAPDYVLEGQADVRAGQSLTLAPSDFKRAEYARLVRKGQSERSVAHAIDAGVRIRTALPNGNRPCLGAALGYALDLRRLSFGTRLGACRGGFDNDFIEATTYEADLELRLVHAWDFPGVTFYAGGGTGGSLFVQRFETRGVAPSRTTPALTFHLALGANIEMTPRFFATLELEALAYIMQLETTSTGSESLTAAFTLRTVAGFGIRL
jgi:hypothetical protein